MNYAATLKNVETQNEVHADSQIILKIYEGAGRFCFSVDAKLGKDFIRSHYPKPEDEKYFSKDEAKRAAVRLLDKWVNYNKGAKKHYALFKELQMAGQPTLFDFQEYEK